MKPRKKILPSLRRRKVEPPLGAKPHTRSRAEVRPFRVLSYNIHQGLTVAKRKLSLETLKEAIKSLRADVVLLQEVAGIEDGLPGKQSEKHVEKHHTAFQLEALADAVWPYYAYGRNSVFSGGHHGNAILSAFPIRSYMNVDISITQRGLVRRGILQAELEIPGTGQTLNVLATHFGLLQEERRRQLKRLIHFVDKTIPKQSNVILGGDFNDWREKLSGRLSKTLGFREAFLESGAKHARTFPSHFPLLKLDRIYFRHLHLRSVERVSGKPWLHLSDHLPIIAEFDFEGKDSD